MLLLDTAEAFEEFGELQAKLEIEADLRTHAEELATHVGVICLCLSSSVLCLFVCLSFCLSFCLFQI